MVSQQLVAMIIKKIDSCPTLKAEEKIEMPWVPALVMPAAEIHALLTDWMASVDKWGELMSEVDTCQMALAQLNSVAASRRVVGL
jgi:hypothetical protein